MPKTTKAKSTKTPAQKAALSGSKTRLASAFRAALKLLQKPGYAKTWMEVYFVRLLREYAKLRKKVDGMRLRSLLGKTHRQRLRKLIRRSTNRDGKTRSRWSRAIAKAVKAGVRAKALRKWLDAGGGISGRAK